MNIVVLEFLVSMVSFFGIIGLIWGVVRFLKYLKKAKLSTGKECAYFIGGLLIFLILFKFLSILPKLFDMLVGI